MQKGFLLFFLTFLFFSCQENASERKDGFSKAPESPADSLFHLVMEGHDVAMAKMGKLSKYKKIIQQKIDSLGNANSGKRKVLLDSLKSIHVDLAAAESAMNEWMDRFDVDSAQRKSADAIKYLEEQKGKVDHVKNRIVEVVAEADSLLKK